MKLQVDKSDAGVVHISEKDIETFIRIGSLIAGFADSKKPADASYEISVLSTGEMRLIDGFDEIEEFFDNINELVEYINRG